MAACSLSLLPYPPPRRHRGLSWFVRVIGGVVPGLLKAPSGVRLSHHTGGRSCRATLKYDADLNNQEKALGILPIVSIVVPFWGYLLGSLIQKLVKPKKELQWRL